MQIPAPVMPLQFASLAHASLPNVAYEVPNMPVDYLKHRGGFRLPASSEQAGDPGFVVGELVSPNVATIFALLTAYTTDQFTLTYPPSGSQTPPAMPPERFFGPEIEPGSSCLLSGLAYVNFGPGGTQRNGPGNPIQFLVGPYNAYRVIDLCTLDANGAPTFFLTPIDANFVRNYVRSDTAHLPFIAAAVGSPSSDAVTNPNGQWFTLLYNFAQNRWEITHQSTGNFQTGPGGVVGYSGTQNLPEVCPALQPLVAKNILIFDQTIGHYEAAAGPKSIAINPGDQGSLACFTADSTGPASYTFKFTGDNWSLTQNP